MKKLDGNPIVRSNFHGTQAPSTRLGLFTAERSHGDRKGGVGALDP